MGFLSRAFAGGEQKNAVYERWLELLNSGGARSKAGPSVTIDSAFRVAVFFACIRKIAQGCAQVPFKLFRSVEVGGLASTVPATDHYLYDLMAVQPNAWNTSYEFRESMAIHAALGNAYAFKNMHRGEIGELILISASVKKVQRDDYSIVYQVTGKSGRVQEFPAEAIWHVRGPSFDGLLGLETLNLAREALGLAIATEESHAKLHANGIQTNGTYSVDGTLQPEQYAALKAWILKENAGAANAGLPMILDRGAKWLSTSMSGLDAQHLETRKHQIEEVCRVCDVLPIMIGYSDKTATFASAEAMFLAHVVHTMSPWWTRIEESANVHLLSKKDRQAGLYFKHVAGGLLRGSHKDRSEYFAKALGSGGSPAWMTQDEVRALEELNPMGGEASQLPKPPVSAPAPAPDAEPEPAAKADPLNITINVAERKSQGFTITRDKDGNATASPVES